MLIPSISSLSNSILLYFLLIEVAYGDIQLGSTLNPNSNNNWNSADNSFSLGFIPVGSSFTAAITFSGIPIWKAGGDSGLVDSNSRFEFLRDGNLRLTNGSNAVVWQSNTTNRGVTIATLDDSGNLVLKNDSATLWSTFDNPTDTIVTTQSFTTNKTLKSGPYSFNLLGSGNLTLKWNNTIVYWNQGLNSSIKSDLNSPSLGLTQTGILQLNDLNLSSPAIIAYSNDFGDVNGIRFVRLDSDGNLRIYSSVKDSGNSTERFAAVQDQCLVYGYCGNMGICSYNDKNPICDCPSQNFELVDPNDRRKGCKTKVDIGTCPDNLTMLQLDSTRLLTYPPETSAQIFYVGSQGCLSNCFGDPSCNASTSLSDGSGSCSYKTSNYVSGYHSPALASSATYIKVCGPIIPNPSLSDPKMVPNPSLYDPKMVPNPSLFGPNMVPSRKRFNLRRLVIAYVVFIVFLCFVLTSGVIWLWYYKKASTMLDYQGNTR